MELRGPRKLHSTAAALADDGVVVTDESLREYLDAAGPDDPLRKDLAVRLATWDAVPDAEWTLDTVPYSEERRDRVVRLLAVSDKTAAVLGEKFPIAVNDLTVVEGP